LDLLLLERQGGNESDVKAALNGLREDSKKHASFLALASGFILIKSVHMA
jgi:hypothetical protein